MRRAVVVLSLLALTALGAAFVDRPPPLWPRGRVVGNGGSPPPPPPFVDAGYPGFYAGTYSWGGECMALLPVSASAEVGVSLWSGTSSRTCCKQSGECVELVGGGQPGFPDEPNYVDRGGIAEVDVQLQYGQTNAYGTVVEPEVTNLLTYSRDITDGGWTFSGTGSATANAYLGPFGTYLGANEMTKLTDTSGADSFCACQTASATAGAYTASAWMRANDAGAARLSMTGVGNSGGNRTHTITSLATTDAGRREAVVGAATSFGGGLTAITVCACVGANDGETGEIGVSDFQLERDTQGLGVVSSYMPTVDGGTATRSQSVWSFTKPTVEMTRDAGCIGTGYSRIQYDADIYFFESLSFSGASANLQWGYSAPSKFRVTDGTNAVEQNTSGWFGSYMAGTMGWDGATLRNYTNATQATGTFTGDMAPLASTIVAGSDTGGASGANPGLVGPVVWGNTGTGCRDLSEVKNATTAAILIGDSMSSYTNTDGYLNPDSWAEYVTELYVRNPSNSALQWTHTAGATSGQFARWKYAKMENTLYPVLLWWNGQNDIMTLGMDGGALFAEQQTYINRKAKIGIPVYWFNLSPIGGASGLDGGQVPGVALYNSLLASYCVSPPTNVKCVDVYAALVVPDGGTALNPIYDLGNGQNLNDAGNLKVAQTFQAVYP